MKITASIVLYNSNIDYIIQIIKNLGNNVTIFLIDNSPNQNLQLAKIGINVNYNHTPVNLGFGAAHNIAIKNAIALGSKYHFILNPDVIFKYDVIPTMIAQMEYDSSIGMMMPQILNLDGSIQFLPKLLPSPLNILWRKIKRPNLQFSKFIDVYELRSVPPNAIYNAPILSGCFTLLRLGAIQDVGMYDDRFFMYFEDWDLSRRMHKKYKTLYFPKVSVYHGYESGANKSNRLFKTFVRSAIIYFTKWGWFFDSERKSINKKVLLQFK
jgi:GT2 family glycosyltransferase